MPAVLYSLLGTHEVLIYLILAVGAALRPPLALALLGRVAARGSTLSRKNSRREGLARRSRPWS